MNNLGKAQTYWLENYGCQMNWAESRGIERELKERGWRASETPETADLVLLQTCSVRQTAEDRIWGRLGYFHSIKKKKPQLKIALMGCMADRLKEEIKIREPAVDMVVTNDEKNHLSQWLGSLSEGKLQGDWDYRFLQDHHLDGDFQGMVPIMHGCNNFCTYCIVPYLRGREVSRPAKDVISEIQGMEESGVQEITLLGQNVNSYHYSDQGASLRFPELLASLLKNTERIRWFRFISSHPKDFSDDLIKLLGQDRRLCRHIHLPLQHGSDSVLKAMNRGYTQTDYLNLVDKIRRALPDVTLTTDLMVGFPGEGEDDFTTTLDVMRKIQFDDAFTYYYNPREGTVAAGMDHQISLEVKKQRLSALIDLQNQHSLARRERRVGRVREVLQEKPSRNNPREWLARTENNEMVVFQPKEMRSGRFATVRLKALSGRTFVAEEL